jgi:hypothetical protein
VYLIIRWMAILVAMVFAGNYAVNISELKTVARDATGRVVAMRKSIEPPSDGAPE